MKRLLLLCALTFPVFIANAQNTSRTDTLYHVDLMAHDVSGVHKWTNDTARYHYNQTKYYVTTILPYLREAVSLFNELNEKLSDPVLKGKARREYIRSKESFVKERFEDKIKVLNETQGVLLIKLAARQTGLNLYQQLAEFQGTFAALKWQAWAKFHGFNLNRKYHPEEEKDLERIMNNLGYPLPAAYGGDGA